MNTALPVAGSVFVSIAALIHVYIFVLESLCWPRPATWKTFGLKSPADADVVKPMAFNQGFYNLFLAIVTGIGIVEGTEVAEFLAKRGITAYVLKYRVNDPTPEDIRAFMALMPDPTKPPDAATLAKMLRIKAEVAVEDAMQAMRLLRTNPVTKQSR